MQKQEKDGLPLIELIWMDTQKLNKKGVKIVKAPEKFKVLTRSQAGHQKAPED